MTSKATRAAKLINLHRENGNPMAGILFLKND
jgi:hypothetical protein